MAELLGQLDEADGSVVGGVKAALLRQPEETDGPVIMTPVCSGSSSSGNSTLAEETFPLSNFLVFTISSSSEKPKKTGYLQVMKILKKKERMKQEEAKGKAKHHEERLEKKRLREEARKKKVEEIARKKAEREAAKAAKEAKKVAKQAAKAAERAAKGALRKVRERKQTRVGNKKKDKWWREQIP